MYEPDFPPYKTDISYLTLAISMAIELGFSNLNQIISGDEQARRSVT